MVCADMPASFKILTPSLVWWLSASAVRKYLSASS
eukprot:CAMPEP_0177411816 /NCGR_PEP_ID=MMETSP0368-20130122/65657_1 /TAXON_ID=447022 ORGANISM="Scrippsiella hangoei-like, Strain SHHI-4" /NCGR_SAMPLE_ID=MMETSP0368 /ASSEMBLY_ACC=CAM_ASM_000363 /LENGTH=34 /DNA_ID= /DNA_START= /DNA_END= /DNA_ORIENTATION=